MGSRTCEHDSHICFDCERARANYHRDARKGDRERLRAAKRLVEKQGRYIEELKAERELLHDALRNYRRTYPTCPCGGWADNIDVRPHAPGCPVARVEELVMVGGGAL